MRRALWLWAADLRREFNTLDPPTQRAVWTVLWYRLKNDWRVYLPTACLVVAFGGLSRYFSAFVTSRIEPYAGSTAGSIATLLAWLAVIVTTYALLIFFIRPRVQRMYREVVRRNGVRVCLGCGYDLRGSTENANCPECGTHESAAR